MFNLGLLSDAALTGLSEDEKSSLQKQATQQFLLGSLLSNDPSMGLKSALSVPDQYLSGQRAISEMQEKRRQRGEVSSFLEQYAPTPMQAGQQSFVNAPARTSTDYGPSPQAAQRQIDRLNAPIDYNRALTDSLRLSGNPAQPQIRETLNAMQPKYQGDLRVDNNGNVISGLPTMKDGVVSQYNPLTRGYASAPVQGYRESKILSTPPEVRPGQMLGIDASGMIEANVIPGAPQATQQLNFSEQLGKGQASLQTTPTNVIDIPTGRQKRVTEAQALGMPTSLSPSEQQAYEGYKPIRDAAFLGAESAKASDVSLQNLQNILNRGNFKPGKFAVAQSEIASIATGLGIGGERARLMSTDSALTVQAVSDITAARIKEMGSAISNADVTFSAGRGPQISNQEEAMQFYIDLNSVVNKRKKDYSNYVNKNAVPDVTEKWSQTSQGSSSVYEDPKLRKYLPKFPVTQGPDKGKTAYQLPTGAIVLFD
jgi:hypothetical protein